MMKQWRKGIKIKLKNPVCRRHSKSSEKTKAPSLGHATPKLSPPPHPTAAAQANPGREEGTGSVCGQGGRDGVHLLESVSRKDRFTWLSSCPAAPAHLSPEGVTPPSATASQRCPSVSPELQPL